MVKSYSLQIRLNHDEQLAFFQAASKEGMEMATWVRWVCLRAASETLSRPIEELVPREPPTVKIVANPNNALRVGDERTKIVANPNNALRVGDERTKIVANPNNALRVGDERTKIVANPNNALRVGDGRVKRGLGAVRTRSK